MPIDIHENVVADGDTDDEFDQRELGSPVHHSTPHRSLHILVSPTHNTQFSDHFTGTSFGATHATLDDILNEIRARNATDAERDNLIYVMHEQQTCMMQHIDQIQTQQAIMMEDMGQMQAFQTNMTNDVQLI